MKCLNRLLLTEYFNRVFPLQARMSESSVALTSLYRCIFLYSSVTGLVSSYLCLSYFLSSIVFILSSSCVLHDYVASVP